ncbi:MAG: phosphopantothenoylcysteine decarboxylase [Candidatus Omnitrophota bacterium]
MKKPKPCYRLLITAGPSREYIDPVRFISNPATGLIGYLIAALARRKGHKVKLLTGPTHLKIPAGVNTIKFNSALELKKLVNKYWAEADCIICTAAVGDFRPKIYSRQKLKKSFKLNNIKLVKTPDILAELGKKKKPQQVLVGFALETDNTIKNAKIKLKEKNLDFIVANTLNQKNNPFGRATYDALILDVSQSIQVKQITKDKLARIILDRVEKLCYSLSDKK